MNAWVLDPTWCKILAWAVSLAFILAVAALSAGTGLDREEDADEYEKAADDAAMPWLHR